MRSRTRRGPKTRSVDDTARATARRAKMCPRPDSASMRILRTDAVTSGARRNWRWIRYSMPKCVQMSWLDQVHYRMRPKLSPAPIPTALAGDKPLGLWQFAKLFHEVGCLEPLAGHHQKPGFREPQPTRTFGRHHARISWTGWRSSTPVRRKSRPRNRNDSRAWSMPSKWRIVAWTSLTETGRSTT